MTRQTALDAIHHLHEVEQHNNTVSLEALGDSIQLADDVLGAHDLLEEVIGASKGPFDEGVVTTGVTFLLAVRYHLVMAVQAVLRGHRNLAYVQLRRGIEAAAFAGRIAKHPDLVRKWRRAHDSEDAFDKYKKAFGTSKLFPADHAVLRGLGETYDLVATFSHPSLKALAGHVQVSWSEDSELEVRFDYLQLDEADDAADIARTFLAVIQSNIRMLKVFAEVFAPAVRDSGGRWDLRVNTLDANFGIHAERWRPALLSEEPSRDPTDVALRRLFGW